MHAGAQGVRGVGPLLVAFEGIKEAMVYFYIPTYYEI
jgi:hypothetical protein